MENPFNSSNKNVQLKPKLAFGDITMLIISIPAFPFMFTIAIYEASWVRFIMSALLLSTILYLTLKLFKRKYYVDDNQIFIYTYNSRLLRSITYSSIKEWNCYESSLFKQKILILNTPKCSLIIESKDYVNFFDIVQKLKSVSANKNVKLKYSLSLVFKKNVIANLDKRYFFFFVISMLLSSSYFGKVISSKENSDELVSFTGEILAVSTPTRGSYRVFLTLKSIPEYEFEIHDDQFKTKYKSKNEADEYIFIGKKVKLYINESDLKWKRKLQAQGFLYFFDQLDFDVIKVEG